MHYCSKKIRKPTAILLLVGIMIASGFILSPLSWQKIAKAVTGDYTKSTGDSLGVSDWNNLVNDFLDKSGDSMSGNLNMNSNTITGVADPTGPTDVVNQQTMQAAISSGSTRIEDTDGDKLRMVCGDGPVGGWSDHGPNSVQTVIDTSAAGFTTDDIKYVVSLDGANAGVTTGTDTIYNATANSFELHISYHGWNFTVPGITGAQANTWGWQVHWCGIGQ